MVDESDKGDSIHKVDTVPPPEGDGDAYNAATKVGPVSQDAWAELIRKANEEGERNAAASGPSSRPFGPPSSTKPAPVSTKPTSASQPAIGPNEPLPRVYDEADEDDAATKLNDSARDRHGLAVPPSMQPAPPPPVPARAPVIEHVAGPSVARAAVASVPPSIATASVPPTSQRIVRPLAFQPGDPAMPPPVAEPSLLDGRTLVITAVICVIVFLAGVGVFVFAR